MPLSTKFKKPPTDPTSSPFDVQIEVQYVPQSGDEGSTSVQVVVNWPAGSMAYVANSIAPQGSVDSGAGKVTWTRVAVSSGRPQMFELQLSCNQSGSGPHILTAQSSDAQGDFGLATPRTINCPS